MPIDKHPGKQGCNFLFRDHEIFNPRKNMLVFARQFLFMFNRVSSASLFVASLLIVIYLLFIHHLASCFVFVFIRSAQSFQIRFCFCSVWSVSSDYSLVNYSV
jgi:hypothetical protein